MRTLQLYVRERCGTRYADKAKARECEAGHKAPEKIVRVQYRSLGDDRTGYPLTIEARMTDGATITYKREGGR